MSWIRITLLHWLGNKTRIWTGGHLHKGGDLIELMASVLYLGPDCCVQDNNLSEESTNQAETDAAGDVPNTTRKENNIEKQSTQYLTRFGNVPTSSGKGRERDIIDSTINTN